MVFYNPNMGLLVRIGTGFDVHPLVKDRPLVLGGVTIPHAFGLLGHSDADVVCHAVTDALLGAMALGDMGRHFPPGDDRYAGADSGLLLKTVVDMVREKGWRVGNMDCTVIAEKPKLAPHVPLMRANLAAWLNVDEDCVSVKATTTEHLGFTGRAEGIAAQAVVLALPL